ncbi:hypothetical protein psal_cds_684 [Pandoravirus salinus]|uniref:Uncharacterized protein n=1 Tax=Pandoravirus salinus TaxID=1349410 RepID=S4W2C9_9VIRU|nr:hypothetical protein psal_cds_684 [Pandoravirus salinus]AGO84622.1 hypothetical protein psal_cds_684 [Pandoravirus salinus]
MFQRNESRSSPKPTTAAGPDGRPWFAVRDDEDGWRRLAAQHNFDVERISTDQILCRASGGRESAGPGPVGDVIRESCRSNHNDSAAWLYRACDRSPNQAQCAAEGLSLVDGKPRPRPLFPADYAETVASRSGIDLDVRSTGLNSFVDTANTARLCVLARRSTVDTPFRRQSMKFCYSGMHTKSDRFGKVYEAAIGAGASPEAAVRATQLVEE